MWDNNYSGIKIESNATTGISGEITVDSGHDNEELYQPSSLIIPITPDVQEDEGYLFAQYEALSPNADRPLHKVKLVMLGGSGSGKTSILNRFVNDRFETATCATIGADMLRKEILIEDQAVVVEAWDTAGQERFRSLGSQFYRGADVCCLVYDSTNVRSFEDMKSWLDEFCFMMEFALDSEEFKVFPKLVLANKADLPAMDHSLAVKAKKFCQDYGLPLYKVSARTSLNVEQVLLKGIKEALERKNCSDCDTKQPAGLKLEPRSSTQGSSSDPLSRYPRKTSKPTPIKPVPSSSSLRRTSRSKTSSSCMC